MKEEFIQMLIAARAAGPVKNGPEQAPAETIELDELYTSVQQKTRSTLSSPSPI